MKHTGNNDPQELARELSPAEQRRLEKFNLLTDEMIKNGYRRTELTVSIIRANYFALILLIPLFVIGLGLFILCNSEFHRMQGPGAWILFLVVFAALVVVHELIHGASWAVFAPGHFSDIEFGIMKQYLTPYCTCLVPLSRGQYLFGALMPLLLLGVIPMAAGIMTGSFALLLMGIIMFDAAAGDIMIAWKVATYKSSAREVVFIDHPTQAGGIVFERD